MKRSATLVARGVRVVGTVQGENAKNVVVKSWRIGGSVQVKQGGAATVASSRPPPTSSTTRTAAR